MKPGILTNGLDARISEETGSMLSNPVEPKSPRQEQGCSEVKPCDEELNELGILFSQGRYAEMETAARRLTQRFPLHGMGWKVLGTILQWQGRGEEAVESLQKAASLLPRDAETYYNLGIALEKQGQLPIAEASYRRALEINPHFAVAFCNLGIVLQKQGRLSEAEACYRRTLEIQPDFDDGYNNLGTILKEQGQLSEAVACYRRALELKPHSAAVHNNLGTLFKEQSLPFEAEACYRHALAIMPDFVEAHNNLGTILNEQDRYSEAEACYRRALDLKPDYAEAFNNLGSTRKDQGRLSEAEACYRQALDLKPDYEDAFGNLLFVLNYHPDKSGEEIFSAYQEYDNRFGMPHRADWRDHPNSREVGRRLRIGYVSPDFRFHSVRHFLEPLLAHHDKQVVEVYAYAELTQEDAVTARYKRYVDHWIPTLGLSDEALADRIREDSIDILVDLAGHTGNNRLQVFARKPAPVSVSWLGYGYTTGLTAIDYMLTDAASVPVGSEGLLSEKPWRIETPNYVYRPAEGMGQVSPLPAVTRGFVTFGTLTRSVRINHRTVRVWSEILKQVDGARLVLDQKNFLDEGMQAALVAQFAAHGIARERLEIGYHSPPWDVLRGLDIGLDCFPHNSGTTLFETLYMGIPFVTLAGRPSVGRIGSSILIGAGHPEWIALTEEEYVTKAVALATDVLALASLRARLRAELEASPLMDEKGFARKVDAAYQEMFGIWSAKNKCIT